LGNKSDEGDIMFRTKIVPALVAGTLVGGATATPVVLAAADEDKKPTMEQRVENAEGAIKDAWLDGKLESALLFNEHLNSFDIDTKVENGVAYLSGAVESDIDRDLAGEIAESIEGVRDVENQLEVDKSKATMARDDDEAMERQGFRDKVGNATLTARVKTQLMVNSNTSGLAINVDSKNGDVTLTGEVESDQERDLAEQIAANTSGADSVDNQLTVAN